MSEIVGTVEAVSRKFDKFSVLVNGGWYSTKKEWAPEVERGDEISFDDGGKKYLSKVKVLGSTTKSASTGTTRGASRTPGFPVGTDTKDRSIVRQNSLNHAVNLVSRIAGPIEYTTWEDRQHAMQAFADLAVDVARTFEEYSSGDGDAEAAKALMEKTAE